MVERWLVELTNKRIRPGVFRSVKEPEAAIQEYISVHNGDPRPFVWNRTADQILDSIARFAQRTVALRGRWLMSRTTLTGDQQPMAKSAPSRSCEKFGCFPLSGAGNPARSRLLAGSKPPGKAAAARIGRPTGFFHRPSRSRFCNILKLRSRARASGAF